MRTFLSERNIVIALFIIVLVTFSLAQEDSRKFDKIKVAETSVSGAASKFVQQTELKTDKPANNAGVTATAE
jgi:hypothetical protein